MGAKGSDDERRSHRRAETAATALMLRKGVAVGRFVVQNLSAGGALLTGTRAVDADTPVRVLLELPGREPLGLDATVVRTARAYEDVVSLAVAFRHRSDETQDAIQDLVVDALMRDRSPLVLVVEDDRDLAAQLVRELGRLGRRALLAPTPLDAVRWLEADLEPIEAAVVDLALACIDGPDLMGFLAEEYPWVRRVGLRREIGPIGLAVADVRADVPADVLLDDPWDPGGLRGAFN